jgi:hypothetical protein
MITNKDLPLIRVLSKLKAEDINPLLDVLPDSAIEIICESVFNVLHTDIRLSAKKKSHLKKFIRSNCNTHRLQKISKKSIPISKRKKALKQEGKGLPMLLASAIPFLIDLFTGRK